MVDPAFSGLMEVGFYAVAGVIFLIGIAQVALQAYAQRSLNAMHQQGLQAVIAANDLQIVDDQVEDDSGSGK